MPVIGSGAPSRACGRGAEQGTTVLHLGQDPARDVEQAQQVGVPVLAVDVVQHGARGVARVGGVHFAPGQPPQQKRIDRAECQLAAFRRLARARDLVQQPGELGGREVGVDQEAGALPHQGVVTCGAELAAALGGPPVLPDDRAVHRLAGRPLPQHHGLTLVGDAECGDPLRLEPGFGERLATDRERVPPDGLRVMLHPARARVVLLELALALRDRRARAVEHDRARAGGALIDRQDVMGSGHAPSPRCGDPAGRSLSPRGAGRQRRRAGRRPGAQERGALSPPAPTAARFRSCCRCGR